MSVLWIKFLIIAFFAAIFATPFNVSAQTPAPKPCFDFTGTGRTSFATIAGTQSPSNLSWNILSNGGDNSAQNFLFGYGGTESRDGIIPGYYDNDNRADAAVSRFSGFQSGSVTFYVRPSTLTAQNPNLYYGVNWGTFPDLPRPGDYDGDGRTDLTVVRRNFQTSELFWWIFYSATNTFSAIQFGFASDLTANGADYNGDGRDELTVIRTYPNPQVRSSTYFAGDSRTGTIVAAQDWGGNRDIYVIGDYLGDRRADFAVMRKNDSGTPQQNAVWYVLENGGNNEIIIRQFGYGEAGAAIDLPVCGDYNGDGKQDIALYRGTENNYYWLNSPGFNSFSVKNMGNSNTAGFPIGYINTVQR